MVDIYALLSPSCQAKFDLDITIFYIGLFVSRYQKWDIEIVSSKLLVVVGKATIQGALLVCQQWGAKNGFIKGAWRESHFPEQFQIR
jgi:hypothetical protein